MTELDIHNFFTGFSNFNFYPHSFWSVEYECLNFGPSLNFKIKSQWIIRYWYDKNINETNSINSNNYTTGKGDTLEEALNNWKYNYGQK